MKDVWIIDDRPEWMISEEEKRQRYEEACNILGPERSKQIEEEVKERLAAEKKQENTGMLIQTNLKKR